MGGGFLLGWASSPRGGTGYEKFCMWCAGIFSVRRPDSGCSKAEDLTNGTYGW